MPVHTDEKIASHLFSQADTACPHSPCYLPQPQCFFPELLPRQAVSPQPVSAGLAPSQEQGFAFVFAEFHKALVGRIPKSCLGPPPDRSSVLDSIDSSSQQFGANLKRKQLIPASKSLTKILRKTQIDPCGVLLATGLQAKCDPLTLLSRRSGPNHFFHPPGHKHPHT